MVEKRIHVLLYEDDAKRMADLRFVLQLQNPEHPVTDSDVIRWALRNAKTVLKHLDKLKTDDKVAAKRLEDER